MSNVIQLNKHRRLPQKPKSPSCDVHELVESLNAVMSEIKKIPDESIRKCLAKAWRETAGGVKTPFDELFWGAE